MTANWKPSHPDFDWRGFAACHHADPAIFFPQSDLYSHKAKLVCSTCPVREQGLGWAMGTGQSDGIWGGMTAKERRNRARALKKAHADTAGPAGEAA